MIILCDFLVKKLAHTKVRGQSLLECFHSAEKIFGDRSCIQYIRREVCVDTSQVSMTKYWDGLLFTGRIPRIPDGMSFLRCQR